MFDKKGIYYLPLGGADEIGLNTYVYAVDGRLLVVDVGYLFLNDDYPGIDLGLADASFLEEHQDKIDGLVITHAHEDHYGAIGHAWSKLKCPVYATAFTAGMIKERLKEYPIANEVPIHVVPKDGRLTIGNFDVEFCSLVHAVPETSAIILRTPYGNIVHATDWRFDDGLSPLLPTNFAGLEKIAAEGVLALICNSTNIMVEKYQPSEKEVRDSLMELIPPIQGKGLVVTCFPSNLVRLESLILSAHEGGRTPVLVGKSLIRHMATAKDCGYFQDMPTYLEVGTDSDNIPKDKLMYICTGSQANYRSALTLIANKEHKYIKLESGDTVIFSSRAVEGGESKVEAMQEKIIAQGATVITKRTHLTHTTGHANKPDVKRMYDILKPQIVIPAHGEKSFILEHRDWALKCGVPQAEIIKDSEVALITSDGVQRVGCLPGDILGVDRKQLVSLQSKVIKNRTKLMYNCSVFISVVFGKNWALEDLQISSIDIIEEEAFEALTSEIKSRLEKEIPAELAKSKFQERPITDYIRGVVRKTIENRTGIKPVTFMHFYKK